MDMEMDRVRPGVRRDRSIAGLLSDLWRESSMLVRQEAELAKAEISEKVEEIESAGISMMVGGAVLFAGLIVLLFAAVAGLARVLPPDMADWLSPLIVGLVVALVGAAMLMNAKRHVSSEHLRPDRTLNSLRRDRDLAREHLA